MSSRNVNSELLPSIDENTDDINKDEDDQQHSESDTETKNFLNNKNIPRQRRAASIPFTKSRSSSNASSRSPSRSPLLLQSKSADVISSNASSSSSSHNHIQLAPLSAAITSRRRLSETGPSLFRARSLLQPLYLPKRRITQPQFYNVDDAINKVKFS